MRCRRVEVEVHVELEEADFSRENYNFDPPKPVVLNWSHSRLPALTSTECTFLSVVKL